MVAFILLLGLIVWGIVAFFRFLIERAEDARDEAESRRIRDNIKREQELKESELIKYGWQPKKEFTQEYGFSVGDSWDIDCEEDDWRWKTFLQNSAMNEKYLKVVVVRDYGQEMYLITNYYRAEWYVEKLWIKPKGRYEDFSDWVCCWESRGSISQKLTSKKKALEAINSKNIWFDNDLTYLEEVKAAAGTGEFLHVKYWGGSRIGKPRYLTVLEVSCFEGGEEEGGDTWYAEVRERGARKDKTYRIDRMQLLPVNPADLIENA